jgi:membrane protease YdiL (CAAX protease family)
MLGSLVPLAIGFGLAYAFGSFLLGDPSLQSLYDNMTPGMAVPFVLFIALVPGIVEELFYRGYIQRRLLQRWKPAWAIGVTAVIFALMHVTPLAIVSLFPVSVWLGVVAWRSNSIYATMLCHAFINGSVNAWRLFAMFTGISETAQAIVLGATLVVSAICFVQSLRLLFRQPREAVRTALSPGTV